MRDIINYFYEVRIDKISNNENVCIVESRNNLYILKKILEFENTIEILENLKIKYYKIILTKNGTLYCEYNNEKYVLFMITNPTLNRESNLDIILVDNYEQIDYERIWKNNIEYYMKYINKSGCENKYVIDDLNYYIGMAENAILIYNYSKNIPGNNRMVISHYRIKYPNYNLFYCDPTELLIDSISRDIAEYIKAKFFCNEMSAEEALDIIKKYNLSEKEMCLLISRLVYPNYYFDIIKENNKNDRKSLVNISKKRKGYERFLQNIIKQTKTANFSINIEWLNN